MEKIKFKLHEWKQKCNRVYTKVQEAVKKLKWWAIKMLIKVEDKMGKKRRCQFCYENFACEEYFPTGKGFWREFLHPHRCTPRSSSK